MNTQERIKFVVAFAGMNLAHHRAGDWLNLRDDFNRFLGFSEEGEEAPRGPVLVAVPAADVANIEEKEFAVLQTDLSKLLSGFASRTGSSSVQVNVRYNVTRFGGAGIVVSTVRGAFRDCILALTHHILSVTPNASVELCPDCGRIFYREGKWKYCGRTCTNRAMTKAKRKRDLEALEKAKHSKTNVSGKKKGVK
jgi:hypothetical protein